MKRSYACISAAICLGLSAASAAAQPMLDVEQPVAVVFQPFQPLPEGEVMMVTVQAPMGAAFDGELEITPTDAADFEWSCGQPITARLNENLLRREASRYVGPVSVPADDEKRFMLRWRPENRAFVPPGRCDLLIDVRLFDQAGTIVAEHLEIPVSMEVLTDTALSIAGTSGTLNADRTFAFIDFGELETAETAFILFNAQANTDVEFTIESENSGALVSLDEHANRIAYSARFDGSPLALNAGEVIRRRPEPSLNGSRYRLDIEIGDVSGAFAGQYQDNLTVEMVAQ